MRSFLSSELTEISSEDDEAPLQPLPSLLHTILRRRGQTVNDLEILESDCSSKDSFNVESVDEDAVNAPSGGFEHSWTSPVVGSRDERAAKIKAKEARYRKQAKETELQGKVEEVLDLMKARDVRLGQFLASIFNPVYKRGKLRHNQFFQFEGEISQILNWWVASQSAADEVTVWAVNHVADLLAREAKVVTSSKILQTRDRVVDHKMVESFNLRSLQEELQDIAPVGLRMLSAMSTSPRAHREHTDRRKDRTEMASTYSVISV